jgi:hypothetical protein
VEAVAEEVGTNVAPFRANVLTERELSKRFRIPWTPTFVFLDGEGLEHHRFIGFLPPDEFAAQIHLAGARAAFNRGAWEESARRYAQIAEKFPETDAAPESVYWIGVCDFKRTKNVERIYEQGRETAKRYPNHIWGKKLSFLK